MKLHRIASIVCLASLSACYTTTVRTGAPPGATPLEAREHWHSGFVAGIADASGPYDLQRLCPGGWSEVRTETSFWNGLVQMFTSGLYNPQTTTVVCAGAPAQPR